MMRRFSAASLLWLIAALALLQLTVAQTTVSVLAQSRPIPLLGSSTCSLALESNIPQDGTTLTVTLSGFPGFARLPFSDLFFLAFRLPSDWQGEFPDTMANEDDSISCDVAFGATIEQYDMYITPDKTTLYFSDPDIRASLRDFIEETESELTASVIITCQGFRYDPVMAGESVVMSAFIASGPAGLYFSEAPAVMANDGCVLAAEQPARPVGDATFIVTKPNGNAAFFIFTGTSTRLVTGRDGSTMPVFEFMKKDTQEPLFNTGAVTWLACEFFQSSRSAITLPVSGSGLPTLPPGYTITAFEPWAVRCPMDITLTNIDPVNGGILTDARLKLANLDFVPTSETMATLQDRHASYSKNGNLADVTFIGALAGDIHSISTYTVEVTGLFLDSTTPTCTMSVVPQVGADPLVLLGSMAGGKLTASASGDGQPQFNPPPPGSLLAFSCSGMSASTIPSVTMRVAITFKSNSPDVVRNVLRVLELQRTVQQQASSATEAGIALFNPSTSEPFLTYLIPRLSSSVLNYLSFKKLVFSNNPPTTGLAQITYTGHGLTYVIPATALALTEDMTSTAYGFDFIPQTPYTGGYVVVYLSKSASATLVFAPSHEFRAEPSVRSGSSGTAVMSEVRYTAAKARYVGMPSVSDSSADGADRILFITLAMPVRIQFDAPLTGQLASFVSGSSVAETATALWTFYCLTTNAVPSATDAVANGIHTVTFTAPTDNCMVLVLRARLTNTGSAFDFHLSRLSLASSGFAATQTRTTGSSTMASFVTLSGPPMAWIFAKPDDAVVKRTLTVRIPGVLLPASSLMFNFPTMWTVDTTKCGFQLLSTDTQSWTTPTFSLYGKTLSVTIPSLSYMQYASLSFSCVVAVPPAAGYSSAFTTAVSISGKKFFGSLQALPPVTFVVLGKTAYSEFDELPWSAPKHTDLQEQLILKFIGHVSHDSHSAVLNDICASLASTTNQLRTTVKADDVDAFVTPVNPSVTPDAGGVFVFPERQCIAGGGTYSAFSLNSHVTLGGLGGVTFALQGVDLAMGTVAAQHSAKVTVNSGCPAQTVNGDFSQEYLFGPYRQIFAGAVQFFPVGTLRVLQCPTGQVFPNGLKTVEPECQADGTWNFEPETCEAMVCATPDAPPYMYESPISQAPIGTVATMKCSSGTFGTPQLYQCNLSGSDATETAGWVPMGAAVSCRSGCPHIPKHANWETAEYMDNGVVLTTTEPFVGAVLTITCMSGFMSMVSNMECLSTGWALEPVVFEETSCVLSCPAPSASQGSWVLMKDGSTYMPSGGVVPAGTQAELTCTGGATPLGTTGHSISCNSGDWSEVPGDCYIPCPSFADSPLFSVAYSDAGATDFKTGVLASFTCKSELGLHPTLQAESPVCRSDGTWSVDSGWVAQNACLNKCIFFDLETSVAAYTFQFGATPLPNNSEFYVQGTTGTVSCVHGYVVADTTPVSQTGTFTCLDTGLWPLSASCVPLLCASKPILDNEVTMTTPEISNMFVGETTPATCKPGYERDSPSDGLFQCSVDPQDNTRTVWQEVTALSCSQACPALTLSTYIASFTATPSMKLPPRAGDTIAANCASTAVPNPDFFDDFRCLSTGEYSIPVTTVHAEACVATCPGLPNPPGGSLSFTRNAQPLDANLASYMSGTTASLMCANEGYELSGSDQITCNSGQWGAIGACVKRECLSFTPATGFKVVGSTGPAYLDTVDVGCADGYAWRDGGVAKQQSYVCELDVAPFFVEWLSNGPDDLICMKACDPVATSTRFRATYSPAVGYEDLPGTHFVGSAVTLSCSEGFRSLSSLPVSVVCANVMDAAAWVQTFAAMEDMCVATCPALSTSSATTIYAYPVAGVTAIIPGETVTAVCRSGYSFSDGDFQKILSCQATHQWSSAAVECVPAPTCTVAPFPDLKTQLAGPDSAPYLLGSTLVSKCGDAFLRKSGGVEEAGVWVSRIKCVQEAGGAHVWAPTDGEVLQCALTCMIPPVEFEMGWDSIVPQSVPIFEGTTLQITCEPNRYRNPERSADYAAKCQVVDEALGTVAWQPPIAELDLCKLPCERFSSAGGDYSYFDSSTILVTDPAVKIEHSWTASLLCPETKRVQDTWLKTADLVCDAPGLWNASYTCIEAACGAPPLAPGQATDATGPFFVDKPDVLVKCARGFQPVNGVTSHYMACESASSAPQWVPVSSTQAQCDHGCDDVSRAGALITVLAYSSAIDESTGVYGIGTTATVQCTDPDSRVTPAMAPITCIPGSGDSGVWSVDISTLPSLACVGTCPVSALPPLSNNRYLDAANKDLDPALPVTSGVKITVECGDAFTLPSGAFSTTSLCTGGTWSTFDACMPKSCASVESVLGSHQVVTSGSTPSALGTIATVSCKTGFVDRNGASPFTLECGLLPGGGREVGWVPRGTLECVAECPDILAGVTGASYSGAMRLVGTKISIGSCPNNLYINPLVNAVVCQDDGTGSGTVVWSQTQAWVQANSCQLLCDGTTLPLVASAMWSFSTAPDRETLYPPATVATQTCAANNGLSLGGNKFMLSRTQTCDVARRWSTDTLPTLSCAPMVCPPLDIQYKDSAATPSVYNVGVMVTVECAPGYTASSTVTTHTQQCKYDGTTQQMSWSLPVEAAKCEVYKPCTETTITKAFPTTAGFWTTNTDGSVATFTCNSKFVFSPARTETSIQVKCTEPGWEAQIPTCLPVVTCASLTFPTSTGLSYGSSVDPKGPFPLGTTVTDFQCTSSDHTAFPTSTSATTDQHYLRCVRDPADVNKAIWATAVHPDKAQTPMCFAAPVLASAQFTGSGLGIVFKFNAGTTMPAPATATAGVASAALCQYLFPIDTLAKLGTGPTCFWAAPNALRVNLGASFTAFVPIDSNPGSDLFIKGGLIRTSATGIVERNPQIDPAGIKVDKLPLMADSHAEAKSPDVKEMQSVAAIVNAPSRASVCSPVTINALPSVGGAGKPLVFLYTLVSASNPKFVSTLPPTWAPTSALRVSFTDTPGSYIFSVAARNWFGAESAPTKFTIDVVADAVPAVSIDGGTAQRAIAPNTQLTLTGSAHVPNCADATSTALLHSWRLVQPEGQSSSATSSSTRTLSLKPFALRPQMEPYVFEYSARLNAQGSVASKVRIDVIVTSRPMVARLSVTPIPTATSSAAGSTDVGASSPVFTDDDASRLARDTARGTPLFYMSQEDKTKPLTLYADGSRDPDQNPNAPPEQPMTYTWTCHVVPEMSAVGEPNWTPSACPIAALTSDKPVISAKTLDEEFFRSLDLTDGRRVMLVISVAVKPFDGARMSRAVIVGEFVAALGYIAAPTFIAPSHGPRSVARVSAAMPLRLSSAITTIDRDYALMWTCDSANIDLSATGVLGSPLTGPHLVIAAGALQPNTAYTFRLSIFHTAGTAAPNSLPPPQFLTVDFLSKHTGGALDGEASSATVTLQTSALPTGGSCKQLPAGDPLVDDTTMSVVMCSAWTVADETELPLRYRWSLAPPEGSLFTSASLLAVTETMPYASVKLHAGSHTVLVEVSNRYGVATTVSVNVTHTAQRDVADVLGEAKVFAADGDSWSFVQSAGTVIGMLNKTEAPEDVRAVSTQLLTTLMDTSTVTTLAAAEAADRASTTEDDSEVTVTADDSGSTLTIELIARLIAAADFEEADLADILAFVRAQLEILVGAGTPVSASTLSAVVAIISTNVDARANSIINEFSTTATTSATVDASSADTASQVASTITSAALMDVLADEDPIVINSGTLSYVASRLSTSSATARELTVPSSDDGDDDSDDAATSGMVTLGAGVSVRGTVDASLLFSANARQRHTVLKAAAKNRRTFAAQHARTQRAHSLRRHARVAAVGTSINKSFRLPGALLSSLGASRNSQLDASVVAFADSTALIGDVLADDDTRLDYNNNNATLGGFFAGTVGLKLLDASGLEVEVNEAAIGVTVPVANGTAPAPAMEDDDKLIYITVPHEVSTPVNYTSVCQYYDETAQVWSTAGCAVAEVSDAHTVCKCNHLTMFSIRLSPRFFQPSFIDFSLDSFADLTWAQIVANPVPIITLGALLGATVIFMIIAGIVDRQFDRQGIIKLLAEWHPSTQISLTRADEYGVAADASTLAFLGRRFFYVLRRDHPWLSPFIRPTTDDFGSQSRVATTMITVLIALTIAATFFGAQEQEAAITIAAITTLITFPINQLFQLVFDNGDTNRLKRWVYYYAEQVAFLHVTKSSEFFNPDECARILAVPMHDIESVQDLFPTICEWNETEKEAASRAKSQEVRDEVISSRYRFPSPPKAATPCLRVPNPYTTHRTVKRNTGAIHLLLRSSLQLDIDHLIQRYESRPVALRFPRGWRLFGMSLTISVGIACVVLVLVLGMQMDRDNGASVVRNWILTTLASQAIDAVFSGPILTLIRSTIVFMIKYAFFGSCWRHRAKRYECMPKLNRSRRLSFTTANTSFLEVLGQKANPQLIVETGLAFEAAEVADSPSPSHSPETTVCRPIEASPTALGQLSSFAGAPLVGSASHNGGVGDADSDAEASRIRYGGDESEEHPFGHDDDADERSMSTFEVHFPKHYAVV